MEKQKKSNVSAVVKYQEKKIEDQRIIKKDICFNKAEWNEVTKLAELSGVKPGIYIRKASLLSSEKLIKSAAFYLQLKTEIRKVGVNVNQIARVLNATKEGLDPEQILEVKKMNALLYDILNKIS